MPDVRDIDVAAAEAAFVERTGGTDLPALSNGGATQPRNAQGQFAANTPATEAPPAAETVQTPEPAVTPDQGTDEPSFTHIDDSTLTPELLQLKRSLQADYTRKTQEAAPWRKLGGELGVESPDDFRAALQVYTQLQDPRNWPAITQELSTYMQQMGMSPQQAQVEAANQLAQFAPDTPVDPGEFDDGSGYVHPQLLQAMQSQQQQIQQLTQHILGQEQQRQAEAQWQNVAMNLTRMEGSIRAANPHYNDGDVEAIYNLLGQDGDLHAAQQRYESLIGGRLASYLAGKEGAMATTPSPTGGGLVHTEGSQPAPGRDPNLDSQANFDNAHRAAMAHIAELERLEAQS